MSKRKGITLALVLAVAGLAGTASAQNPALNGSNRRGDTTSGPDAHAGVIFRRSCTISSNDMAVCSYDENSQGTELTFNQPVRVPGKILQPGTYWFTLKNPEVDHNIVQILDRNRKNVAVISTIPTQREKATNKPGFPI